MEADNPYAKIIDADALLGADASRRDAEIRRILLAPDRFPPKVFAPVSRALYSAGRLDEARTWYFRGQIRFFVDTGFFGADTMMFYAQETRTRDGAGDAAFETFLEKGDGAFNDRAVDDWTISDIGPDPSCAAFARDWPPSYGANDHPMIGYDFAASARADAVVVSCSVGGGHLTKGALSALQLPLMISVRGSPFAPLVVDATGSGLEPSSTWVTPLITMSADGRYLLLRAKEGQAGVGLIIDMEARTARALRVTDASMRGLARPYEGFQSADLISDPPAVIAMTNRGLPGEKVRQMAQTILVWPLDGSAVRGFDLGRGATTFGGGVPWVHRFDHGPVAVGAYSCHGNCGWPDAKVPPNGAPGFRSGDIDHDNWRLHWLDVRDMWVGTDDEARAKYGNGAGPIHCEAETDGRVTLWRRWAVQPHAAREFPHGGPVWCAVNSQAHRLVVGVGRYAHIFDIVAE